MAVWNTVNFQSLFAGLDLSAEHYHPDKLHWLKTFQASNGKAVGEVARNPRNLTKRPLTLSATLPVFDLGAGSRHVLQTGDAIEEERVSTKKIAKAGDILVSRLRSYLRQVAIVPASVPKAHVSTEFIVLRPPNRTVIAYLLPFILSKQVQTILAWSQDGNEHPRFNEKLLLELQIPPAIAAISGRLNDLVDQVAKLLFTASGTLAAAEAMLNEALGLADLDLTPRLFYETRFAETAADARLDAEYFSPRMQNLIATLSRDGRTIADVAPLAKRRFKPKPSQPFDYIEIADVTVSGTVESKSIPAEEAPSRAQWIVKSGDIITSTVRPIRRLSALIQPEQSGFVCSSGFAVLQPKDVEPEVLLTYLRLPLVCELLDLHTTASMYPAISTTDILRIPMSLPDKKTRQAIAEKVRESFVARKSAQAMLNTAKRAVEIAIEESEAAALQFLKEERG